MPVTDYTLIFAHHSEKERMVGFLKTKKRQGWKVGHLFLIESRSHDDSNQKKAVCQPRASQTLLLKNVDCQAHHCVQEMSLMWWLVHKLAFNGILAPRDFILSGRIPDCHSEIWRWNWNSRENVAYIPMPLLKNSMCVFREIFLSLCWQICFLGISEFWQREAREGCLFTSGEGKLLLVFLSHCWMNLLFLRIHQLKKRCWLRPAGITLVSARCSWRRRWALPGGGGPCPRTWTGACRRTWAARGCAGGSAGCAGSAPRDPRRCCRSPHTRTAWCGAPCRRRAAPPREPCACGTPVNSAVWTPCCSRNTWTAWHLPRGTPVTIILQQQHGYVCGS